MTTVPFYAYIVDAQQTQHSEMTIFRPEKLLVFAMYLANNNMKFVYEEAGRIRTAEASEVLFSHVPGEETDRVLCRVNKSTFFNLPRKEAIEKGYIKESVEEKEETVEEKDEENNESTDSPDKGQKPKSNVRKRGKSK